MTAWGKNLADTQYYVEYGDAFWSGIPSGDDIGWLGPQRSFGLDVHLPVE